MHTSTIVYFYNYGWMDYGVPALKSVLDMVKVIEFAIHEGKVAIHCHAGLGRTGVLIACYLIYSKRMCGDEAITTVRERRLACMVLFRLNNRLRLSNNSLTFSLLFSSSTPILPLTVTPSHSSST